MNYLAVFGAAAFGALLGSALTWHFNKQKVQVDTAFAMHHEYSDELVREREELARFIDKYKDAGDWRDLWRALDPAEMACVWKIVYFYDRLSVAYEHRYIKRKLVPDLFGDAFNYWYSECFKEKLVPVNDPTARHIETLRNRLVKHVSARQVEDWESYRRAWQRPKQSELPSNPPVIDLIRPGAQGATSPADVSDEGNAKPEASA
jgi:hypothetical protein